MSARGIQLVRKCGGTLAILAVVIGIAYSLLISREVQAQTVNWVLPTLGTGFIIGLFTWGVAVTFVTNDRIREARHKVLNDKRPAPPLSGQPARRTYLTTFPLSASTRPMPLPWPMKWFGAAWYAIGLGVIAIFGAAMGFKLGELQFDPSLLRLIPTVFGFVIAAALYVGVFRIIKPADLQQRWEIVESEEDGLES